MKILRINDVKHFEYAMKTERKKSNQLFFNISEMLRTRIYGKDMFEVSQLVIKYNAKEGPEYSNAKFKVISLTSLDPIEYRLVEEKVEMDLDLFNELMKMAGFIE